MDRQWWIFSFWSVVVAINIFKEVLTMKKFHAHIVAFRIGIKQLCTYSNSIYGYQTRLDPV